MKTLRTLSITLTLIILIYAIRTPILLWAFNRDQPPTPDGWAPRYRTWKNGVEQ